MWEEIREEWNSGNECRQVCVESPKKSAGTPPPNTAKSSPTTPSSAEAKLEEETRMLEEMKQRETTEKKVKDFVRCNG